MRRRDLVDCTRRHFFQSAGFGLGSVALASLNNQRLFAQSIAARVPHFAPRAKSVIFLFMAGGPSQLDLLDHKPALNKFDGQPCPEDLIKGERFAFIKGVPKLLGSPHTFRRTGQSGAEVSELLPNLARIVDDIAVVKSVHTTQFNHAPAQIFMNTGHQIPGRPSMGAWLSYGIGSESQELPGFVVLLSGRNAPDGGRACWGSGFLPSTYQGVEFRRSGDPVLFVSNPEGMSVQTRRRSLNLLKDLNTSRHADVGDPEIASRISAYELAYKMQTSVPELSDISKEPAEVHALYGTQPGKNSFANNCLLARRLVERGVRMVECFHRGWDTHGNTGEEDIVNRLTSLCRETDGPAAALVQDLKRRGLLDSTLVVWGGEFGRTPMNEERQGSKFLGRDHHARAFTMWLAGGGIKPGTVIGATDDIGYNIVRDPVSVHDLHATMLHLLGLDHTRLTHRFQGRDFRLTDVEGEVVGQLIA